MRIRSLMSAVLCYLLVSIVATTSALAIGTPFLIKDITTTTPAANVGSLFDTGGGIIYFSATNGTSGNELFKFDGTTVTLLKDINPGPSSSNPGNFVKFGTSIFFTADDGVHGIELWKTDGTTGGTSFVADINTLGNSSSNPSQLTAMGANLYFVADDGIHGFELWKSDGTVVSLVQDVNTTTATGSNIQYLKAVGTKLFFWADDGINGIRLWAYDGTASSMTILTPTAGFYPVSPIYDLNGSKAVFAATDYYITTGYEPWVSDGTVAGTIRFDVTPGYNSGFHGSEFGVVSGFGYFMGGTMNQGSQNLYRTNGASAGYYNAVRLPQHFVTVGTNLFFVGLELSACTGNANIFSTELRSIWKTDGTTTQKVATPNTDCYWNGGSPPSNLTNVNGTLYFASPDSSISPYTNYLWRSNGTTTTRLATKGMIPQSLAEIGGTLYFSYGGELWSSDGTDLNTVKIPINSGGNNGTTVSGALNINGITYFVADDGVNGAELWKSDGTAAGTVLVKDINPGLPGSSPANLTTVNGTLYFSANDPTNGNALWKSDGTNAGTIPVFSGFNSLPTDLIPINGTLYFSANDPTNGIGLWKSDGTNAGTVPVFSGFNSQPASLTNVNGLLYFSADYSLSGAELWKSDGTAAGTVMVKDIAPSLYTGSNPSYLTTMGGVLYFSADDGTNGVELWKSDGTAAGTVMVKDINAIAGAASSPSWLTAIGGKLFFIANDGTNSFQLFVSDGTTAGTTQVKVINSPAGAFTFGTNPYFIDLGGVAYFSANDGINGVELWKSDGTATGTSLVKDIFPGAAGSGIANVFTAYGRLYFTANDGVTGTELWQSDGTAAGTNSVADIFPGSDGSNPTYFVTSGAYLHFFANNGIRGNEPMGVLLDTTPPTDGTLTAPPGSGQIVLTWSAATDNLAVTGYKLVTSITAPPADCSATALYSGTALSYTNTGLTNGTTSYYRVCATDAAGNWSVGATASATPQTLPPGTPVNIVATPTSSQVGITWDAVTGATYYNIYRSTTSGILGTPVGLSTTNSFTDTTVVNGTIYFYTVKASNSAYRAYVANSNDNTVSVIDTNTNTVVATISVPAGANSVAVNAQTNRVYVSGYSAVSVIDATTNTVLTSTIALGNNGFPAGLAVNPQTNRLYVTQYSFNSLTVFDTANDNNSLVATIPVGTNPMAVTINQLTDRAYVTNWNNTVSVINTATNSIVTTVGVLTGPRGLAVNPLTKRLYVANFNNNNVSVIDTTTNTYVNTIATFNTGNFPSNVAVNPATNRAYVLIVANAKVSVVDTTNDTVIASVSVVSDPYGVAIDSQKNRLYVTNRYSTAVSVIDTTSNTVVTTIMVGIYPDGIDLYTAVNGGEGAASNQITVPFTDTTPPTITISAPSISLTKTDLVTYTVTYADANFSAATLVPGTITLNTTGTANASIGVTGSGTTRTVTLSNMTGDGTIGISIAAGSASDLTGNLAPAAGPSATFAVDNTPPITTPAPPAGQIAQPAVISLTSNEPASIYYTVENAASSASVLQTAFYNGHLYHLLPALNWTDSEALAQSLGGHLATVNDEAENAFIYSTFTSNGSIDRGFWIGLNDAALEGTFVWANGENAPFRKWAAGEPNNSGSGENWTYIFQPGDSRRQFWNDAPNTVNPFGVIQGVVEVVPTLYSGPISLTGNATIRYYAVDTAGNIETVKSAAYTLETPCTAAPTGLASWWQGENNAVDQVGANNGTLNGVTFAAGKVGQAFSFNGSSNISVPDAIISATSKTFSVSAWVNPTSIPTSGDRIIFYGGANSGEYSLNLLSTGYSFNVKLSDGAWYSAGSFVPTAGTWNHLVGIQNGNQIELWVDGVQQAASIVPSLDRLVWNGYPSRIGSISFNTAYWVGLIDEVQLYNKSLLASEIVALYNAGNGSCTATPVPGTCGSTGPFTVIPSTNLCTSPGAASTVTGSGHPWNWSCAGTNGGADAACTASIQTYSISISAGTNGSISAGSVSQTIDHGSSTTAVTATANPGYHFVSWSGTGGFVSTSNPMTVAIITADMTITANFASDQSTLLWETFDLGTLPVGWSTVNNSSDWRFDTAGNLTGGSGGYAINSGYSNAQLLTPALDMSALSNPVLEFKSVYTGILNNAKVTVDVSTDGGLSWNTPPLLQTSTPYSATTSQFPLAAVVGSSRSNVLIRFTFQNFDNGTPSWAIDDVKVYYQPDLIPPVVTDFTTPLTSPSRTITITSFSSTDAIGVTGYLLKDTPAPPLVSDPVWSSTPPTSYNFRTWGNNTLYAYTKDAAGNISVPKLTVVLIGPTDGIIVPAAQKLEPTIEDALKSLNFAMKVETPTAGEFAGANVSPLVNGIPQPPGSKTTINLGDTIVTLRRVIGL